MVKITKPPNFDEIKKRGGTDRHIVKRVADTASANGLDSDTEDDILEAWIENNKPEDVASFQPYEGRYPSTANNRLQDYFLVYKEVELGGYRIDSIIRHPDDQWELIEVKTDTGVGLGVIGHILAKRAQFEDIFKVKPSKINMTVVVGGRVKSFQTAISKLNEQYGLDVEVDETGI